MTEQDAGLRTLLELSGQDGIRYSLTLHAPSGQRTLGYDNAHAVRVRRGRCGSEGSEIEMKVIRIGIAPQARIRDRMLAIARGELKPKPSDPKIWFTSMRSLSQVLSDENRALLEVIRTAKPESISELAVLTGRKQGNLSRTLKTMSGYGLVKMVRVDRKMRPVAEAERYQIVA
jgi:predicted transcriptional regulator